jgi:Family of unknown function (DUF6510)
MNSDTQSFLDGNAAAGPLREVFAPDLTTAAGQCAGCGHVAVLAQARLYTRAPGIVARCTECDCVLLRLVTGTGRTWIDMRGLTYLQVVTPQ